jgi:hypothetical protein
MPNIEGKIAAILSPVKVVINRGSTDGVEEGDYFVIYTELGPFSDPDTKQNLGTTKQVWGRVEVTTVEKRFCIAETETRLRNPFLDSGVLAVLLGTTQQQIRLPVNEGQIWKGLEKIEIGFPARLMKPLRQPEELPTAQPSLLPPAPIEENEESEESN